MSTQTHALPTTISGQVRRKLTVACEVCRRRKARCSGVAPCTLCRKNSFCCEFNYDRQRRGPVPRPSNPRAIDSSIDYSQASIDPNYVSTNCTDTWTFPEASTPLLENGDLEPRGILIQVPTHFSWRDAIQKLLNIDETFQGETKPSQGLISHLLTVFRTHVTYQAWMLDLDDFLSRLIQDRISPLLLYAVCAVSVNFSRHASLLSVSGQAIRQQFAALARRRMIVAPEKSAYIDRIQALCLLALYETSESNGKQAYCDIAAAHVTIKLAVAEDLLTADDNVLINLSHNYLYVTERQLCLGHEMIPTIGTFHQLKVYTPPNRLESVLPSAPVGEIFDLLLKISNFSRDSHSPGDLNPLSIRTEFMRYCQALDKFFLCYQEELRFDPEGLRNMEESRQQFDNLQCSLAWHCCVIILNRVYLPIPVSSREGSPSDCSNSSDGGTQDFPVGRGPSLEERIKACESSASVICSLCQDVMSCGQFLLPLFMGYCCFQSCIVLINQFRRKRSSNVKVIDNLKVNFTILGAMREFYIPAQIWIHILFESLQNEAYLNPQTTSLEVLFSTYFARFKDIKEPPYIPLENSQLLHRATTSFHLSTSVSSPKASAIRTIELEVQDRAKFERHQAWLREYHTCLESHITDLYNEAAPGSSTQPALHSKVISPNFSLNDTQHTPHSSLGEKGQLSDTINHPSIERHDIVHSILDGTMSKKSSPSHADNDAQNLMHGQQHQPTTTNINLATSIPQLNLQPIESNTTLHQEYENSSSTSTLASEIDPLGFNKNIALGDMNFATFLDIGTKSYLPRFYSTYDDDMDWTRFDYS